MSSSASGSSGAEPIGAGLASSNDEMKVLKQYPGNLLKFFLRAKRELSEGMVSLTAVGRASDQQMEGPALKENRQSVCGDLPGVVGFVTFLRKVLFLRTVCTSEGHMVLFINRKDGRTRSGQTHEKVSKDSKR